MSGKVLATVPLGGKPEFAVFDPKAKRLYCNIEDKSTVVAIDAATHAVADTWPIAPGESTFRHGHGFENHQLFIGCENKLMVMMDNQSGKVVATVPIGQGVDANAFDPETRLAFASSSDGTLTVARPEGPDKLGIVQRLSTPPRSRTMTLDPTTHRLYVAAAEFLPPTPGPDGKPAQRADDGDGQRLSMSAPEPMP